MLLASSEYGFIDKIKDFVTTRGATFGLNLLGAIAIYFIGKWVVKIVVDITDKLMEKSKVDETLRKFVCILCHALLLTLVIIAALNQLGVNTTSFAAILAAAGLAIGLALQGSLSNFASGVMIILFKPFKVGDFVELAGVAGVIQEVQIFNTIINTPDNVRMILPNSTITGGSISNYSFNDNRRIDLIFGCGYNDNIKDVKEYLEKVLSDHDKVLSDPAPVVAVLELGDSSVNFVVRPWVKNSDYWDVRFDLTETIRLGFDEKGFTIPYPTQDLNLHTIEK